MPDLPEATLPEATVPEATLPKATLPKATLPEAAVPAPTAAVGPASPPPGQVGRMPAAVRAAPPVRWAAALAAVLAGAFAAALSPAAATAYAPGDPTPAASDAPAPVSVCVIDDSRAIELSGLVTTADGYVVISDSNDDPEKISLLHLDKACKVTKTLSYPTPARDPEDVAISPDGNIWVADIGDNVTSQTRRATIALWLVSAEFGTPAIHRLTYPDGPHDAEALLFNGNSTPIIVTKETSGVAGLYEPTGPLMRDTPDGVAMRKVGEFRPVATGVPNALGELGELLVTGAATTPDRTRVALRTYTAAYEWDVVGDVVTTITTTEPRVTVLRDEPQGEAIAYTVDGQEFLTVSDEPGATTLRRYERTKAAPAWTTTEGQTKGLSGVWLWVTIAAGMLGLGILVAGLVGMRRARATD